MQLHKSHLAYRGYVVCSSTNKKAIATNQPAISNCYLSPVCVWLRRKIASSSSIEGKEDRQKKITELHENISRKFIQVLSRCKAYFERNTHVSHTSSNAAPSLNDAHSIRNVLQCQHIRCKTSNSCVFVWCQWKQRGSQHIFQTLSQAHAQMESEILIASTCLGFDERARALSSQITTMGTKGNEATARERKKKSFKNRRKKSTSSR